MSKKILIVEDQFIGAFDLQLILEGRGYIVVGIAHDAREAYVLIELHHPDLVCLDIFLRGNETGIEIAANLQLSAIPFIFISANTYEHIDRDVENLFPRGYISKPFQEQDVIPVIETAFSQFENEQS